MSESEIGDVVKAWKGVWEDSGEEYVQIFENRGAMMVRPVLRSRFVGPETGADALLRGLSSHRAPATLTRTARSGLCRTSPPSRRWSTRPSRSTRSSTMDATCSSTTRKRRPKLESERESFALLFGSAV